MLLVFNALAESLVHKTSTLYLINLVTVGGICRAHRLRADSRLFILVLLLGDLNAQPLSRSRFLIISARVVFSPIACMLILHLLFQLKFGHIQSTLSGSISLCRKI